MEVNEAVENRFA